MAARLPMGETTRVTLRVLMQTLNRLVNTNKKSAKRRRLGLGIFHI